MRTMTVPLHEEYALDLDMMPGKHELETMLKTMRGRGEQLFFICYDITTLRRVNYAYGREAGDRLLTDVAAWMRGIPGQTLYRVESDLFCMLFSGEARTDVLQTAREVEYRFSKPWALEVRGKILTVFTCAAISVVEDDPYYHGQDISDVLERSVDLARSTGQIATFSREQDVISQEHLRMQIELKSCILSGMAGFSVVYQPIADPATGTWRGVEALCRWESPSAGPIPPGLFIKQAEEMGLIHLLGEWVLESAIAGCMELGLDEVDDFFLSVNVSAGQVAKSGFAYNVLRICEQHRYPCYKLLLEITESTEFTFNDATTSAIKTLRYRNVMFALDDFGTGYSDFKNLKNLPVDFLKTEQAFIEDIESDAYLQYFYFIMSETAHTAGMRLIAEGVENQDQLFGVTRNGADLVQGYLFGRPMSAEELKLKRYCFTKPLPELLDKKHSIVDFKNWISSQEAYKITPALFRLQNRCMNLMLGEDDLEVGFNKVLGLVGSHFRVSRVTVFLRERGTVFSSKYEWCDTGVASQMALFQNVDGADDGFYDLLNKNEIVTAGRSSQLPVNLLNRLAEGLQEESIQSLVVLPMKRKDEILGFVSMDDEKHRDWLPDEILILYILCLLYLLVLAKNEEEETENA